MVCGCGKTDDPMSKLRMPPHLFPLLPFPCPPRRPLKITARDAAGPDGSSLLSEDALTVELQAGRPAQLGVEGPGTLAVGTKAAIPQLRVRVCDAAGNPTASDTFEVPAY